MENATSNGRSSKKYGEKMPATERVLIENTAWKQIQKNTFTRWCNEQLKVANKRIASIESDFSDGLRLIDLLEVLAQKRVGRYNKRPNFRQMKLENVSVALKFLEAEKIKIVNIDSKAIVDGNLKLILGLVWTLILNYSISMPMWDEEPEQEEQLSKTTPKQRLLAWIQNKIPQMPITNFTGNWEDGLALGALVDNCAPGLCPDWDDWDPEDKIRNSGEAMKLAEKWLGVPQVITPQEITDPNVDEMSVMTYLSEFPKAQLKTGAPLRPKTNSKKVRAYGKGLEESGCKVGAPADFTVESFGAGSGKVSVFMTDPNGLKEEIKVVPNHDKLLTYSVTYYPKVHGIHEVSVLFAGSDIQKSPFVVFVEECPIDPSKVTVKGKGLEPGVLVGNSATFTVCTEGAGGGNVEVIVADPNHDTDCIRPEIKTISDDLYQVSYTPEEKGLHQVTILYDGTPIPNCPYMVSTVYPFNPDLVWVEGRGIKSDGLVCNQLADFIIHTEKAGEATLDVRCIGPHGMTESVNISSNNHGLYGCTYTPSQSGQYVISINYGGKPSAESPYRVNIFQAPDPTKVTADGPGLNPGNMLGVPTHFDIFANDCGKGDVDVEIQSVKSGMTLLPVQLNDLENGTTRCSYNPQSLGKHSIDVKFAGQSIKESPYQVYVIPAFNPAACRAYGRGIQATGLRMREKAEFRVSTEYAGEAELKAVMRGKKGGSEPVIVRKNPYQPKTYDCEYHPPRTGDYKLDVTYGGKHIPSSPFKINIGPEPGVQKLRAFGPGLVGGKVGKPADFVVESIGYDLNKMSVSIQGPSQAKITYDDKQDGSCDVSFIPTQPGEYAVHVLCDGSDIKNSPFMAQISSGDHIKFPKQVVAFGPGVESNTPVNGNPTDFTIDASSAGDPAPIAIIATAEGSVVDVDMEQIEPGIYRCTYTPKKAVKHTIIPTYDGIAIKESPFRISVLENSYPERVTVHGPGVAPGLRANEPTYFTVDCSHAGRGDLSARIIPGVGIADYGQTELDYEIVTNKGNVYTVKYTPKIPGEYTVMIFFANKPIPSSPVTVFVSPSHDASKVWVEGPGLYGEDLMKSLPTYFTIFAWEAGKAKPKVAFKSTSGKVDNSLVKDINITEAKESTYSVRYTPEDDGEMDVVLTYGGDPVPGSPFRVNVIRPLDLTKVKIFGLDEKIDTGKLTGFEISTNGAGGRGVLNVSVIAPDQSTISMNKKELAHGTKFYFTPEVEGIFKIVANYDEVPIRGSPFIITSLIPPDPDKVVAYGSGLSEGISGSPAYFTVDTQNTANGGLNVTIDGPSEAAVQCTNKMDGTCSVSYLPTKPGHYKINVFYAKELIPGSPFKAKIAPSFDASKVKIRCNDTEKGKVGKAFKFEVDCKQAGNASVDVHIVNHDGTTVPLISVKETRDKIHDVTFIPDKPGMVKAYVKYGGVTVPNSPVKILIKPNVDVSKVSCAGRGVGSDGVFSEVESNFTVNAKLIAPTGGNHIKSKLIGPTGASYTVNVVDNKDGSYVGSYIPIKKGPHLLYVEYDEVPVPGSPFSIEVKEGCDPGLVKAFGPGLEKGIVNSPAKFIVDTRCAGVGRLGVAVDGPCKATITCTDKQNGTGSVEYLPTAPGKYQVSVTYEGKNIQGSPFLVRVKDIANPKKVVCQGPGLSSGIRAKLPQEFTIDCKNAGVAPLQVKVKGPHGESEDVHIKDNGNGTYRALYTPSCDGPYQVQVKYGDQDIPKSPYRVLVLPTHDASKVILRGPGLLPNGVLASLSTQFTVDTREAGQAMFGVDIVDSHGRNVKTWINDELNGTFTVTYIPVYVGNYTIITKYGGDSTLHSPYRVRAQACGNPRKCRVYGDGLERPEVGQEGVISVEPSHNAGKGKVHCFVTAADGKPITVDVVENKDGSFDVFYTPENEGPHNIDLTYGGENLLTNPFLVMVDPSGKRQFPVKQEVIEMTKATPVYAEINKFKSSREEVDGLTNLDDLRPVELTFEIPIKHGKVTSTVTTPSGRKDKATVHRNGDETVTVEYQPYEKGLHEMEIFLNEEHIKGSPIQFYADAIAPGHVTAYGRGLMAGKVNEEAKFTVVTKDVGSGGLALAIEGPSKAEITCEGNKDGTCSVSYLPTSPGKYSITVQFDDKHIEGSPFTANIADKSQHHKKLLRGTAGNFSLKIGEMDISLLKASVQSPSGKLEECIIKKLQYGHIGLSFTPQEAGDHLINITKNGQHVSNSPFRVMVDSSEVGYANKVKVYGSGCEKSVLGKKAQFMVDTKAAGYGNLSFSVEGPSKVDIHCEDVETGLTKVSYTPQELGTYIINVKFADRNVPGSPFKVKCKGHEITLKETVTKYQEAVIPASVGSRCELNLKIPVNIFDLVAEIESPSGEKYPAEIIPASNDVFNISFMPKENGLHFIGVTHQNEHVHGSPFKFTVGLIEGRDANDVTAGGPGLQEAVANEPAEFSVWTREGGPGKLSIAVEGPSKAEILYEDGKDGSCGISYLVAEPGAYEVSVKFNDEDIPESPYSIRVLPSKEKASKSPLLLQSDATKVRAFGGGIRKVVLGENSFMLDCSEAGRNILLVGVSGPMNPCEEVNVKHIGAKKYSVTYEAKDPGEYMVVVKWGSDHISGSPFRFQIP